MKRTTTDTIFSIIDDIKITKTDGRRSVQMKSFFLDNTLDEVSQVLTPTGWRDFTVTLQGDVYDYNGLKPVYIYAGEGEPIIKKQGESLNEWEHGTQYIPINWVGESNDFNGYNYVSDPISFSTAGDQIIVLRFILLEDYRVCGHYNVFMNAGEDAISTDRTERSIMISRGPIPKEQASQIVLNIVESIQKEKRHADGIFQNAPTIPRFGNDEKECSFRDEHRKKVDPSVLPETPLNIITQDNFSAFVAHYLPYYMDLSNIANRYDSYPLIIERIAVFYWKYGEDTTKKLSGYLKKFHYMSDEDDFKFQIRRTGDKKYLVCVCGDKMPKEDREFIESEGFTYVAKVPLTHQTISELVDLADKYFRPFHGCDLYIRTDDGDMPMTIFDFISNELVERLMNMQNGGDYGDESV